MQFFRELNLGFLVKSLCISFLLVIPIPFFTQIIKEIPFLTLFLGEVSLIFLVVLASYPKAGLNEILKIGSKYLFFIALSFALLGFLPISPKYKLFSFQILGTGFPSSVAVNLIGLIVLNVITCLLFGKENQNHINREVRPQAIVPDPTQELKQMEKLVERKKINAKIKKEVNTLFDLYLKDYELGQIDKNDRLENIEAALLKSIDMDISGALCVDKDGKVLHDTVFTWSGYSKDMLIELFKTQNENSKSLGTGLLCQMLFNDNSFWYIVAKYRGNYLLLQTESKSPAPLLETCYRVFKSL